MKGAKTEIVVFVVSDKDYTLRLKDIISSASSRYNRICFVSLSKPYDIISDSLKAHGIDLRKLFFISAGNPSKAEGQVVYISSPKALTELSITISKVIEMGEIEALIFDSLSTLLVYEQSSTVLKFAHSLISLLREKKSSGFLLLMKGSAGLEVLKDLSMLADRVIEPHAAGIRG